MGRKGKENKWGVGGRVLSVGVMVLNNIIIVIMYIKIDKDL